MNLTRVRTRKNSHGVKHGVLTSILFVVSAPEVSILTPAVPYFLSALLPYLLQDVAYTSPQVAALRTLFQFFERTRFIPDYDHTLVCFFKLICLSLL